MIPSCDILPEPTLYQYPDLISLFRAVCTHRETHPGTVFKWVDRPRERCVGFWDEATHTVWVIGIPSLLAALCVSPYEVRVMFKTFQSRDDLAAQLTHGQFPTPSTISC